MAQLKARYVKAIRKEKALILNEFCENTGYHRKHAIRLLNQSFPPKRRRQKPTQKKRGRKVDYTSPLLLNSLKTLWLLSDQLCGKRLKAALPLWLPSYETHYSQLEESIKKQLLQMSSSTIDRLLKPYKIHKARGGTKPGSLLRTQIPIKTNQWNESQPGLIEADTVAQCGSSVAGDFIWSLTLMDISSGWTENRAVWNKGAHGIITQIKSIAAIPG